MEELPSEVLDAGRRASRLVERTTCREVVDLSVGMCLSMDPSTFRESALMVTRCYQENSGRMSTECEGLTTMECTKKMSSHEFEIYTYFYTHLPAMCLLGNEALFRSESVRLVQELQDALESATTWLDGAEERGRDLEKSLLQAQQNYVQLRQQSDRMSESMRAAQRETEEVLLRTVNEAEVLTARQAHLLRLVLATKKRAEATKQLHHFGASLRDQILLCAILLAFILAIPCQVLIIYGFVGGIAQLPMALASLVAGLLKLIFAYIRTKKRKPRAYTIETSSSKPI